MRKLWLLVLVELLVDHRDNYIMFRKSPDCSCPSTMPKRTNEGYAALGVHCPEKPGIKEGFTKEAASKVCQEEQVRFPHTERHTKRSIRGLQYCLL